MLVLVPRDVDHQDPLRHQVQLKVVPEAVIRSLKVLLENCVIRRGSKGVMVSNFKFSRAGHVLQTLFLLPSDLCTASCLVLQVIGGCRTHSVSALLLVQTYHQVVHALTSSQICEKLRYWLTRAGVTESAGRPCSSASASR